MSRLELALAASVAIGSSVGAFVAYLVWRGAPWLWHQARALPWRTRRAVHEIGKRLRWWRAKLLGADMPPGWELVPPYRYSSEPEWMRDGFKVCGHGVGKWIAADNTRNGRYMFDKNPGGYSNFETFASPRVAAERIDRWREEQEKTDGDQRTRAEAHRGRDGRRTAR